MGWSREGARAARSHNSGDSAHLPLSRTTGDSHIRRAGFPSFLAGACHPASCPTTGMTDNQPFHGPSPARRASRCVHRSRSNAPRVSPERVPTASPPPGASVLAPASWPAAAGETLQLHAQRVVTLAQRVFLVREADASLSPTAPADHCLVCENALTVKYAWSYPPEWSNLADVDLLALFH